MYNEVIEDINQAYEKRGNNTVKCQIFKKTEKHTLKALCYFQLKMYNQAIEELE